MKKHECANCGAKTVDDPGEICQCCEEYEKRSFQKIDELLAAGHDWHCARRQVYGDGKCQCEVKK